MSCADSLYVEGKRSTEDGNPVKNANEKKFQKEDDKQKKKTINRGEEIEIIKSYLSKRYPLRQKS